MHKETGLDPPGIRVRAVPGLVAADYFAPGYFVWAVLIENLAKIGYEEKNLYMAAYDWRLSFQNTEVWGSLLVQVQGILWIDLKLAKTFPPRRATSILSLVELEVSCFDIILVFSITN